MSEPIKINAGDTVEFSKSLADYPASEYTLTYKIIGSRGVSSAIVATAAGDDYSVTIPTSATENLVKGQYRLVGYVTKTGFQKNVYDAPIEIGLNFATQTTARDTREFWQKIIDALEATMEQRASIVQSAMTVPGISGKTLQYATMAELIKAHSHAKFMLATDVNSGRSRKILTTFLPTS